MSASPAPQIQSKPLIARLIPVGVIAIGFAAAYYFNIAQYLSMDALIENKDRIVDAITANPILVGLAFSLLYAILVGFSLPVASGLTVIGGLLFGAWWGFLWSFLGAMGGAVALYLIARYAFADMLERKTGDWVEKLRAGFRENEFSFMLLLRLIIIVPFFVLNVVAGLLNVKFHTYVIATAIGIIPATLLKTFLVGGEIRNAFLLRNEVPELGSLLADWRLWVALVALAMIAILPIIAKRFAGDRVKDLTS